MRRGAVLLLLAALALAAGGITAAVVAAAGGDDVAEEQIWEVRREPLTRRIDASGELRSRDRASIGAPSIRNMWNFTVTSIADEGVHVREGTPLVSFDAQRLREQLEVLTAQLDQARKELEKTTLEQQEKHDALMLERAEIEARRTRLAQQLDVPEELQKRLELEKLRIDAAFVERELELTARRIETQRRNMKSRIGAAESRVKILDSDVTQLREQIQRMTVRAPREGFVVHAPDWNGSKVKVGESIWYGRLVIELADLSRMEVAAEVAEPDAGFVDVGQRVEIRLDAAPDRLFGGRVEKLGKLFRPRSYEDPTMVFDAVVSIDEPDPELMRPGMAAKLEVIASSGEDVIQVPESAVVDDGDGPAVFVVDGSGRTRRVAVQLGARWRGSVVVTSGLEAGDAVVVRRES